MVLVGLLGLGGSEAALRAAKRRNLLPGATPAPSTYDPEIGCVLVGPHQQSHVASDFDVLVRLDRNGRRVPAKTASPLDLQGTIVFVGDSTTFGWGVEAAAAFPEIVGAALRHRVVNLGVPGYGVDQSVTLLERQGLAENPSWVVLMLAGNDLI